MAYKFQPALSDVIPLKYSGTTSVDWTISEIKAWGIANNKGDSFFIIDLLRSSSGFAIRFFYADTTKINVYFGSPAYLSTNNLVGVNADIISSQPDSGVYISNSSGNNMTNVGTSSLSDKTINDIAYKCTGGNSAGLGSEQGIYVNIENPTIYIDGAPLITYTWESVPALTGKGVTKGLSILRAESINDGSAVNDGTASDFANSPLACNVGDIITSLQPIVDGDPTKVAVKYTIPDLTDTAYTSVKLVAKKNKIPKNKTDGNKIIDLSPSSGGVVVSGLEQLTKYYFVIFVEDSVGNKAESEPKDITTGKKDGIFKMRITTMQGVRENDFKETITAQRQ